MYTRLAVVVLIFAGPFAAAAGQKPVRAVVESSLATGGKNIRQFAFDGDPNTCFASERNPDKDDHVTLIFDIPVAVKTIAVTTGRQDGSDRLTAGSLEGSEDGTTFIPLARFDDGTACAAPGRELKAVRVSPGATDHRLFIREFAVESDPPVATFKYPVEIAVESDDPEMLGWVQKVGRICEQQYDMICEQLYSEGFKPRTTFSMRLTNDYRGVAATGGGRVIGSVRYFKRRKDDFGAMVHETVHVVQMYRRGPNRNPGWLVEGIPDYIRFFIYEPGKIGPVDPDRWKYDGAYRQSAAFLKYVTDKYDEDIVRKLNAAMREGDYKPELWQLWTKKSVEALGAEWKATLHR